jgi:hypothetical protein
MSPRLLRPVASGFNPKSIAGLQAWFDASVLSSMTFNSTTVSQWNDLSGNGYHATQSTALLQPTYTATGMNGKPALDFLDTNGVLTSTLTVAGAVSTPTTSPQVTIFSVMRSPTGTDSRVTFGTVSSVNGARMGYISRFSAALGTIADVVNDSNGRLTAVAMTQANNESAGIHVLFRSGTTQRIRYNGTQRAQTTAATSNFTDTTSAFQIGKGFSQGNRGIFSTLLVYNRALSASEIATVERALSRQYGITLA